jgi:hypothetical protein
MGKFPRDLSVGKIAEDLIQALFQVHEIQTSLNTDKAKQKEFDISVLLGARGNLLIEVKYDIYAARSGNIAIEFYNPKTQKDSGIAATKADIWAHVLTAPHSIWFASVPKLKDFIKSNTPFKVIASGGDDNAALYLYKKDFILPSVFYRVDTCEKGQLSETIFNHIL